MNQIDIIDDLDIPQVLEIVQTINSLEDETVTIYNNMAIKGVPRPIQFFISTNEGPGLTRSWFDVIPVVDTILQSNQEVHSMISGICANSILLINLVCCKRSMSRHGYIIVDPLTSNGGLWRNIESQSDEVSNHNSLLKQIYSIFKTYTKIPKSVMSKMLKKHLVFDAKTALKYELVDEII